jgi:micrococcal nuclease
MEYFRYRIRRGLRLAGSGRRQRRRGRRITLRVGSLVFYFVVALAIAGVMLLDLQRGDGIDGMVVSSIRMPVCQRAGRGNSQSDCVVDGDTIRLAGEKIRLQSFNTPEIDGACARERRLARLARRRLSQILSVRPFSIRRFGMDKYGRTLATIRNDQGDIGSVLIREGLAHAWHGRRESWCA